MQELLKPFTVLLFVSVGLLPASSGAEEAAAEVRLHGIGNELDRVQEELEAEEEALMVELRQAYAQATNSPQRSSSEEPSSAGFGGSETEEPAPAKGEPEDSAQNPGASERQQPEGFIPVDQALSDETVGLGSESISQLEEQTSEPSTHTTEETDLLQRGSYGYEDVSALKASLKIDAHEAEALGLESDGELTVVPEHRSTSPESEQIENLEPEAQSAESIKTPETQLLNVKVYQSDSVGSEPEEGGAAEIDLDHEDLAVVPAVQEKDGMSDAAFQAALQAEVELGVAEARLAELRSQNAELRDRLDALESGVLPGNERTSPTSDSDTVVSEYQGRVVSSPPYRAPIRSGEYYHLSSARQQLVGTVVAEKTVVRTGPSRNSVRIMVLGRGTTLPVEYWKGGWTRVSTPTGVRAWVASDTLSVVRYR